MSFLPDDALGQAGGEKSSPGLRLVWSDDFDTDGRPNPEKWGYEHGFVRNRELQWYQPENAVCRGGKLVIEGRRETKLLTGERIRPEFRKRTRAEYTSASLTTRKKFSWKYGRLEVRAKLSAKNGLWPAIWTLGVEGHWPENGEVDVMEFYRGGLMANAAWRKPNGKIQWDASRTAVTEVANGDGDWDQEFHTWRMDWDASRLVLSLDGRVLNEVDLDAVDHRGSRHPFRQPHYLLLNLAIGGTQGGDPSRTEFPTQYLID
ncbi:MAG: glycoside hydrolase family 16 protein, partial [Planctomycetota bacterium]